MEPQRQDFSLDFIKYHICCFPCYSSLEHCSRHGHNENERASNELKPFIVQLSDRWSPCGYSEHVLICRYLLLNGQASLVSADLLIGHS